VHESILPEKARAQKALIYESFLEKMGAMGTVASLARFLHFQRTKGPPRYGICSDRPKISLTEFAVLLAFEL
jgi:hypothetical protein